VADQFEISADRLQTLVLDVRETFDHVDEMMNMA
jgi:hypothetical protein